MTFLSAPDPKWSEEARAEIARWQEGITGLLDIHHIGSTSVPGLPAKPILDLLAVFDTPQSQEASRGGLASLGYEWMGEYGLPGRSYARLDDPITGQRIVQAHGYATGHPDIARHLAFRDALRSNQALRVAYTSIKAACAARHPEGGEAYGACKSEWIRKTEAKALERTK